LLLISTLLLVSLLLVGITLILVIRSSVQSERNEIFDNAPKLSNKVHTPVYNYTCKKHLMALFFRIRVIDRAHLQPIANKI